MFVLERESGDVISMTTGDIETRISIAESANGHVILTIDAPPNTRLSTVEPGTQQNSHKQTLRANYRQELLLF